jgi:rubrerythrin
MQIDFEHSCAGKYQYRNKKMAADAKTNLEINNKNRMRFGIADHKNKGEIDIYFCPFCGYWHIGHFTSEVKHG